jgi:hypothetical protein
MALDLTKTALQIDQMAEQLRSRQDDRQRRLQTAAETAGQLDIDEYDHKRALSQSTLLWNVPKIINDIDVGYAPPALPGDYCVAAVDGSHIDIDRHLPARCFLINIGEVVIRYGSNPDASLSNHPNLYASDDDLVIRDTVAPYREQRINGAVLGARRAVEELNGLAEALRQTPPDVPTLGLIDGSMLIFGLDGSHYQEFVRQELIENGFIRTLEELRLLSAERQLAVASYISLPRSPEVINALRVRVCPYEVAECDRYCGRKPVDERPCEIEVGGLIDRDVFARILQPGERSGLFASSSPIVDKYYKGHEVYFFYVNTGEELGRVEVPSWVAEDEALLGLTHSLIVDQCRKGPGYPVALMEAHEQAVVTGRDRQHFVQLVEDALYDQRLPVYSSEKNLSKKVRWL